MMKNVVFSMRVAIAVAIAVATCAPAALGQSAFGPGTIAYVNESPEAIYVVSGTSAPRRLTPSSPDDENGPLAWSADGRWLAFANGGLVLVDATNGKSRQLTNNDADTSPSWDNAGNLWFRRNGDLFRMRLTGSPQRADETTCADGPGGDVSPDGKRYVYSMGNEIRVCGTSSSVPEKEIVTTDGGVQPLGPRWSPDGQQVAYFTPGEGEPGVFVVDDDGSSNDPVGAGAWPDWSLDGETLVFAEDEQPSRLMLSDVDGSDRRALSAGGATVRGSAPAWGRTFKQATSGGPSSDTDAGSDESDNESGSAASDDDGEPALRQAGTVEADPRRTADPDAAPEDAEGKKKKRSKATASPESFAAPETEGPSRLPLIAGLIAGLAMIGAGSGIGFWLLRRGGAG